MRYVHSEQELRGESRMLTPLLSWLEALRWVREDSVIGVEVPVHGRRVDLVTLTKSGTLSAFELKLGGFSRVLEQSVYNTRSFDRSWMVVSHRPKVVNIEEAQRFGVGILVVSNDSVTLVSRPNSLRVDQVARARIRTRLRKLGT
jgi:hypothetical protein